MGIRLLCILWTLPIALLASEAWNLPSGEIIRGAAISPDNSTLYTWGTRLLAWPVSTGQPQVIRERGQDFGEGGCVWDVDQDGRADVVVQEGLGLGKLVWFHAPDWTRREIDSETEFHECLGANLLGHRGLLTVHRYAQVRFYEPPRDLSQPWESNDIYSIYTPSKQSGLLISDVDGDGSPDLYMGNYWIRSPEKFDLPWRLFAINTYSQVEESALMRLALTPDLVVAQGHLADGLVIRYEKNANIREQWIEHRIGSELKLKFPHGLVSLGDGRFVVSENNGADSRVILFTPQGHRVIEKGVPAHTLFVVQGKILAVGPDQIRWLSYDAELRPGVWAGRDVSTLPLPASGYEVYLVGEMHGLKETEGILTQYLAKLNTETGLRDVAIEEDSVYERDAQAYVDGRSDALPEPLCLRAGVLQAMRRFNEGRNGNERIRVHLVDIDSPATAIRQHLLAIKQQIAGAAAVRVPDDIKKRGLKTVDDLKRLTADQRLLGELRTIKHSIHAYQQGLEVGISWRFKGSPYLDDREEAISSNIQDLLRKPDCRGVLALYGSDHVSRRPRKDGGNERNRAFAPMALRLEQAGVKVFSMVTFPLSGSWSWRGREGEMLWTASDGSLDTGETLDHVLAAVPEAKLLYVDPKLQRIKLPSQDASAYLVDGFLLIPSATPMANHCGTR